MTSINYTYSTPLNMKLTQIFYAPEPQKNIGPVSWKNQKHLHETLGCESTVTSAQSVTKQISCVCLCMFTAFRCYHEKDTTFPSCPFKQPGLNRPSFVWEACQEERQYCSRPGDNNPLSQGIAQLYSRGPRSKINHYCPETDKQLSSSSSDSLNQLEESNTNRHHDLQRPSLNASFLKLFCLFQKR